MQALDRIIDFWKGVQNLLNERELDEARSFDRLVGKQRARFRLRECHSGRL